MLWLSWDAAPCCFDPGYWGGVSALFCYHSLWLCVLSLCRLSVCHAMSAVTGMCVSAQQCSMLYVAAAPAAVQ